jgi:hypothetical protein
LLSRFFLFLQFLERFPHNLIFAFSLPPPFFVNDRVEPIFHHMLSAVGVEVCCNGGPLLAKLQRVLEYFDVLCCGPLLLVKFGRYVVEPALAALLRGDEAQRWGGLQVD